MVTRALVLASLLLAGCSIDGLSFRADRRVAIVEPADRATVALPVTVRWTTRDLAIAEDGGTGGSTFAVFVDRAPVPPGRDLAWLFRDDSACTRRADCASEDRLAAIGVHQTTSTSIELAQLPRRGEDDPLHEVAIVLLDEHGRRSGESVFKVTFKVAS